MVSAPAFCPAPKRVVPNTKSHESDRPLFFNSDATMMEIFISNLYSNNVAANLLAIRYFVVENQLIEQGGAEFANAFFYLTNDKTVGYNAPLIQQTVSFIRNLLGMFFAKIDFHNHAVAKKLVIDFFKMLAVCSRQHPQQMATLNFESNMMKKTFFK
ncbi:hypothetical protein QR680_000719 [Steinernema hermaphroditum]|uniref:Uncharacterized protein n=1 Tax=Steinernema hermaphroditum TaxID=289476 RepID=A0AA39LE52_9BILA|nr:hypothetical protein QR680_000719 [Steinernema hermaphroditum]